MTFILHPKLETKPLVTDLPLCKVLLQDEKHYPWLLLVPKRANASRLIDLCKADQGQLMEELELAQKVIWSLFVPAQLNVATIGNKVEQLHVHVIGRFKQDPAWPATVWDHPVRCSYSEQEKEAVLKQLKNTFISCA